jgi:hypothetical protein
MQRDHVRVLSLTSGAINAFLDKGNPDLVPAAVRFTELAAWTAAQLRLIAPDAPSYVERARVRAASPTASIRCQFCRALFLLTEASRCPNCGAPAS